MRRATPFLVVFTLAACKDGTPPPQPRDATPPTVVARTPLAGDTNVYGDEALEVVFSEPLDPATVSSQTIRVFQGETAVESALSLSGDHTTVRIRPADLAVPGDVFVELTTGIADTAGNAFLGDAVPWTFSLPRWVRLGDPISDETDTRPTPTVAVEASGRVLAAMDGPRAWRGGAGWEALPPFQAAPYLRLLRAADDRVWAIAGGTAPALAELSDAGWTYAALPETSTPYVFDAYYLPRPSAPVLVWNECRLVDGVCDYRLVAWSHDPDLGWTRLGERAEYAPEPAAAMSPGPGAEVFAAWVGEDDASRGLRVAAIGANGFEWLPEPAGAVSCMAAVAVTADGLPVIAFQDGYSQVHVMRWDGVDTWVPVGEPLPSHGYGVMELATDASGSLVLAWTDADGFYPAPRRVFLASWNGAAWQQAGPFNAELDRDVYDVALTLDEVGAPVLAWAEYSGDGGVDAMGNALRLHQLHGVRLNRPPSTGYHAVPVETAGRGVVR